MNLRHTLIAGATAGVALLSLSACGSSGTGTADAASGGPTAAASASGSGTGARGSGSGDGMPGATGQIAAKQGSTLQVQNDTDGQVAVSFTAKTAISAQVAAALKDVTVGSCVNVTPASSSAASSGDSAPRTITAGTVRISKPVDGQCTAGFVRGPGGSLPSGARPTAFPSGMPTDLPDRAGGARPSGAPSGFGGRGGFGANGSVTAVSATGFTVKSSIPGAAASTTTVSVDGATTYTTTKASDASALKVGQCVVAVGQADDTGAVAAQRLVVSAPVDGSCSSGFGSFRRPGGAQGAAQGDSGTQGGAA